MAAISIGDCTVTVQTPLNGANVYKVVTPATADNADTVDVSTVVDEDIAYVSCTGATDGLIIATASAAKVVTIPGATDNEARTIYIIAV